MHSRGGAVVHISCSEDDLPFHSVVLSARQRDAGKVQEKMGMRDQKGREIPWCYSLYRVAYTIVNGGVDSWQHAQKKEVLNERATADIGNGGSSPTSLLLATAPADGRHNPESKQDIFRFTTCQFASAHAILKRLPRQCFPTQE